jgi:conjugal transfer pilus assembly protein TraE
LEHRRVHLASGSAFSLFVLRLSSFPFRGNNSKTCIFKNQEGFPSRISETQALLDPAKKCIQENKEPASLLSSRVAFMKKEFLDKSTEYLRFQRNIFAALTILLALVLVLMSTFLFFKHERIVIVPPTIEKEFWVDGKQVSPTYLEQYGYFLGQLLLGKSSQSAPSQRNILLRHTDPSFSGLLRNKLVEEEEVLKKQNASYTFYPVSITANSERHEVLIEGDRVFYVSGKQVSSEREAYLLSFKFSGSRLLLTGIRSSENRGDICAK